MFFKIWEVAINISEPLLLFVLLNKKLGIKDKMTPFAVISILIMAGITTTINKLGLDFLPTILVGYAMFALFSLSLFKGKVWHRILWATAMIFVVIISNSISSAIFMTITDSAEVLELSAMRFAYTTSYIVLNVIFVSLLINFQEKKRALPQYVRFSVVALCLIGCASLYLTMQHIVDLFDRHMPTTICTVIVATVLVFIVSILVLLDLISISVKKMNDAQFELVSLTTENEHNEQMLSVMQTMREIKHDYASHILAISAYVKEGNIPSLQSYMSAYDAEYGIEKCFVTTGNKTFDSIVTSKALICNHKGIDFDSTVLLPPSMPLNDVETASLFGNLLDNAIEAQDYVSDNRHISLEVKTRGKMIYISVKNTAVGKYSMHNGKPTTSKPDPESHGIGLKRIGNIVAAHNGDITIMPMEDCFEVSILIPIDSD